MTHINVIKDIKKILKENKKNERIRNQLHKALDFILNSNKVPNIGTYQLTLQAYKEKYGGKYDHISQAYAVEVNKNGIQSTCQFEEPC